MEHETSLTIDLIMGIVHCLVVATSLGMKVLATFPFFLAAFVHSFAFLFSLSLSPPFSLCARAFSPVQERRTALAKQPTQKLIATECAPVMAAILYNSTSSDVSTVEHRKAEVRDHSSRIFSRMRTMPG